ncbi:response regulator [Pedobacter rhodius]|uniref:Response regulator n=1 Tax=Pedobacter rhodius TaxID=3004098 RepID=A0ABT4KZZ8_9SPHI|nr:response regulator [Pedobacter sp. SJ11]MCZ4224508.1 response regulator [Pedobacter sp. SJ11]
MQKRILAIDDDNDLLEVFPMIFKDRDYLLKGITDISDLDKTVGDFKPDLILLDIWIGAIDGRVVCNYLKSHEETADIPIVLISGVLIDIDDVNCTPDAILQKPFEIGDLLGVTNELLN